MDQVAVNHYHQPYGVIYNSTRPVGGIRYYHPNEKKYTIQEGVTGTKIIVKIEEPALAPNQEPIAEKPSEDLPLLENEVLDPAENLMKSESLSRNIDVSNDYIVNIQGKAVNFSQEGISRVLLNQEEKEWLAKAQNYFISARQNDIKVGSAEDYTKMDILEALWSAAVTVGVEPRRFIVQMYNESRFNPYAIGAASECGIGQFKKSTAEWQGYDWDKIQAGIESFAYQARISAEFVKRVGEIAYNGSGKQAYQYKERIDDRLDDIASASTECAMRNIAYCG